MSQNISTLMIRTKDVMGQKDDKDNVFSRSPKNKVLYII